MNATSEGLAWQRDVISLPDSVAKRKVVLGLCVRAQPETLQ